MKKDVLISEIEKVKEIRNSLQKSNRYSELGTCIFYGKLITLDMQVFTYNILIPADGKHVIFNVYDKLDMYNKDKKYIVEDIMRKTNILFSYKEEEEGIKYTSIIKTENSIKALKNAFIAIFEKLSAVENEPICV